MTTTSHFVKTVCVIDWWLTKAGNNSLGNTVSVAGIESAGRQAARVFFSAPIVERLDLFTLKTADGIFVLLKGLINKQKTSENGFSEEVFKHFLIGFPSNWDECAKRCFQQGINSEVTADADFNPEQTTVTKMGNVTAKLKQNLRKDSDCSSRLEHYTDEVEEAATELQDDQNIDLAEERSFEDVRSHAQNHNKDSHATINCQDRDSFMNTDPHDSNVCFMGNVVRYHLRNREVPKTEGVYRGKLSKIVAKGNSFSMKTRIGDGTSTVSSLARAGVNSNNLAKRIATIRSMSISGQISVVGNSMHKINKAQKSCRHDGTEPIPQDAGKDNNMISDRSPGGRSCQSKKRKRNERRTARKNIILTGSLLKKTVENFDGFAVSQAAGLENSAKSGGVAVGGNSIENRNDRGEDENRQTPGHLRPASVNNKNRSAREDSTTVKTNVNFSPEVADKLENSTSHLISGEKSHQSKNERKQKNTFTKTTLDRDSERPKVRTRSMKAKSHSKAAVAERERKASQGSMRKSQTRRKLDYAQETTCTPEGGNKGPSSQKSILRTSRSGRVLLPTMEFWRNQLPIYDADHGISGIREGSTILKVKTQKVGSRAPSKATAELMPFED